MEFSFVIPVFIHCSGLPTLSSPAGFLGTCLSMIDWAGHSDFQWESRFGGGAQSEGECTGGGAKKPTHSKKRSMAMSRCSSLPGQPSLRFLDPGPSDSIYIFSCHPLEGYGVIQVALTMGLSCPTRGQGRRDAQALGQVPPPSGSGAGG